MSALASAPEVFVPGAGTFTLTHRLVGSSLTNSTLVAVHARGAVVIASLSLSVSIYGSPSATGTLTLAAGDTVTLGCRSDGCGGGSLFPLFSPGLAVDWGTYGGHEAFAHSALFTLTGRRARNTVAFT